jgi:hypothetical protein
MRDLRELSAYRNHALERIITGGPYPPSPHGGAFSIPSPQDGAELRCIVSAGNMPGGPPWDHVSVSRGDRTPTWEEMDFIARRFFRDNESAMQLHVPPSDHISYHPFCLHIWRPTGLKVIPRPPWWMVGPKAEAKAEAKAS